MSKDQTVVLRNRLIYSSLNIPISTLFKAHHHSLSFRCNIFPAVSLHIKGFIDILRPLLPAATAMRWVSSTVHEYCGYEKRRLRECRNDRYNGGRCRQSAEYWYKNPKCDRCIANRVIESVIEYGRNVQEAYHLAQRMDQENQRTVARRNSE